jgi:uncharacterized protein YjbJ (UPF0337 family)
MNTQTIEGNWMQLKGKIREQWGKLTDDDMDVMAGTRDQLAGRIRHHSGTSVEAVERELHDFEQTHQRPT